MAPGKFRAAKRSSTGSYTSTVTTLVFVCICGLGLWMLTSNSYVSPNKSITRVSDEVTSQLRSRKIPTDSPVFEDNPGNLPDDAIHTDDPTVRSNQTNNTAIDGNADEVRNREDAKQRTETPGSEVDKQPEVDEELLRKTEGKEMPLGSEVDKRPEADEEPKTEDVGTAKDTGQQQGKAVTEPETGTSGSEVEKSLRVSEADEEPKIKTDEVQISEESSTTTTQNQQIEVVAKNNTTVDEEDHPIQKTERTEDEEEEHHITEEEQENRMEKHQQQQEESQNEETSTDQTQHDEEKPTEPHPENKAEPPTEDTATTTTAIVIAPDKDSKTETTVVGEEGSSSEVPKEPHEPKKGWETQAGESKNQKERQERNSLAGLPPNHKWELCNVTTGANYIPCLDNNNAIQKLESKTHFEHRERHCPDEGPMCLVPIPEGYNTPIPWPHSRDKVHTTTIRLRLAN